MRLILAILLIASVANAGMIEVIEDDPYQFIHFDNWNPAIDSLRIAVSLDLDSGYWTQSYTLRDTIDSKTFGYIEPDVDGDDNLIPGHYSGEYWITTIAYVDGETIPSGDTSHVTVDYTISVPIDYQKWQHDENVYSMQIGGAFLNYKDTDGWHEVNNTIVNNAGVYECLTANLKISTTEQGVSSVTFTWLNGVDYTVTQEMIGLRWYRLTDSAWVNIDNSPNWNNLTTPDNYSLKWTGVFPAVDLELIKGTGSVAHKISLRPPFLDSMVILYNQRSDSSDIYLANIMRYTLSANIDGYDVPIGNVRGRILKQFGDIVFSLAEQRLQFPGSDTLPEVPVWQRYEKVSGNIYMAEFVKASHLKTIHLAYPTSTIWHNTEIYIAGSAANVDATGLSKQQPEEDFGAHTDLKVGDDFQPQTRFWHTLIRFNTLDDSMVAVGAATWDSARIGLTLDLAADATDSLVVTAHKITTAGWLEGTSAPPTTSDSCGACWDSASTSQGNGCGLSSVPWTTAGGDYSATRETVGSHADSVILTLDDWSLDDTVYFYISSATVSDTMGNKAGILLFPQQFIDDDNGNTWGFDSDDQSSNRPFLQVWYTTGVAAAYPMRRRHIVQKLQGDS